MVLDEHGHKMSKSLGNVVSPASFFDPEFNFGELSQPQQQAPPPKKGGRGSPPTSGRGKKKGKDAGMHGADLLRLWVFGADFTSNIRLSQVALARSAETKKRIRLCFRYLLGSLADFQPSAHAVPFEQVRRGGQTVAD